MVDKLRCASAFLGLEAEHGIEEGGNVFCFVLRDEVLAT
jgi:hypothetical protein